MTIDSYRAAAIQLQSQGDKEANLAAATALVEHAATTGAKLVALPEMFSLLSESDALLAGAETIPGPTSRCMAALARRCEITLLAGSLAERSEIPGRIYNTSLLIGPDGSTLARYRKIHLFDIDIPGRIAYQESRTVAAGGEWVVAPTPLGRIGLAICYDLRFPGLFSRLAAAGAELLIVPSAFAQATGQDHWEILVRARAIESQCYLLAPNQHGRNTNSLTTFGHTLLVDPWGRVLDRVDSGLGMAAGLIDRSVLEAVRTQLPALRHRLPRCGG